MSASRNIPRDFISPAERTSIRLLLDKHDRGASPAQTMALLNEVDRLESMLRAAAEPEAKVCASCGGTQRVTVMSLMSGPRSVPCMACPVRR